jgi:hypothetical protein
MKLREALTASNCGRVVTINSSDIYTEEECRKTSFYMSEEDIWEPVIEKKKVKIKIEGWANVYRKSNGNYDYHRYDTKEAAEESRITFIRKAVPFTIECEVDE